MKFIFISVIILRYFFSVIIIIRLRKGWWITHFIFKKEYSGCSAYVDFTTFYLLTSIKSDCMNPVTSTHPHLLQMLRTVPIDLRKRTLQYNVQDQMILFSMKNYPSCRKKKLGCSCVFQTYLSYYNSWWLSSFLIAPFSLAGCP